MPPSKETSDHWIVRMNRENRSKFSILLLATVGTHMWANGYGWVAWSLLIMQFTIYPQLLYRLARRAKNQRQAEMRNMAIDAILVGAWAGALGFPVWITFIFLVTSTINLTVFLGQKGFVQSIGYMSGGALLAIALGGFHLSPHTGWVTTLLSILIISLYVLLVANSVYERAITLHDMREQLRVSEQALKKQLDEIGGLQSQLREQANRDPLTGLYNRRFLDSAFEAELARCKREETAMSVILIDIDHFKQINDAYGHQAGDEVLKTLGAMLNDQVRAYDIACRYGGEEFLLLLPTVDQDVALTRAREWCTSFAAQIIAFDTLQLRSTISIGIATYPNDGTSREELIRRADLALYRAKSTGRNRVVAASDIPTTLA